MTLLPLSLSIAIFRQAIVRSRLYNFSPCLRNHFVIRMEEFGGGDYAVGGAVAPPRPPEPQPRRGRPRPPETTGETFLVFVVVSSTGMWSGSTPPIESPDLMDGLLVGIYVAHWRLLSHATAGALTEGYIPGEWVLAQIRKSARRSTIGGPGT